MEPASGSPLNAPGLSRLQSEIGRNAKWGTPDEEVRRILAHKSNYYVVLKVLPSTDPSELRANYFKLSRLVHPDKCTLPQAADASAVVNQAKETLTNPLKKKLYDAYVHDITEVGAEDLSYADWEALQAQKVQIPRWVETLLRIPVLGQVILLLLLLLMLIILLPLLLLLLVLTLLLGLICVPINMLRRCLCGPSMEEEQMDQFEADIQAGAQQQPQQAYVAPQLTPTPGSDANV